MIGQIVARLARDEGGASITEYAVIAALIIVGVIAILFVLGSKIRSVFTAVNAHLGPPAG